MDNYSIRPVGPDELEACLEVIHKSFQTVAQEFGLTPENCPKHTAFIPLAYLQTQHQWGWHMLGLFEKERLVGYMSVSQDDVDSCTLHNLAVIPTHRHQGLGKQLLDQAKEITAALGATTLQAGIIEESAVLKNWYIGQGFQHTGTRKFDHLPFTSGYLVWENEKGE